MKSIKQNMILVASALMLFWGNWSKAQSIELIGVKLENDSVHIIEWNSETPSIFSSVPTSTYYFLGGTSAYNPTNSNYYFRGSDDTSNKVIRYDANTNIQQEVDLNDFYNGSIESDMSNGMMYYYKGNASNEVYIYKYDPYLDTSIELGLLPWSSGFGSGNYVYFPDATCFNSNAHIYHFTIADSSGKYLVSVPVDTNLFTYTITPFNGVFMAGNIGLEYDNENDIIYVMYPVYDTISAPPIMNIGTIDPNTATGSLLLSLPDLVGYEVFNRCFDQASNSLVFVAYDDSLYERKLYSYQSDSNRLNVYELPSPASTYEIEVNNTVFARLKYGGNTAIQPLQKENLALQVYPNPATEKVYIQSNQPVNSNTIQLQLVDALGKLVMQTDSKLIDGIVNSSIDVSAYQSGWYYIRLVTDTAIEQKKLLILP